MHQFALGTGTAASVRVGTELGAGNPVRARRASYTALSIQGDSNCMPILTMYMHIHT